MVPKCRIQQKEGFRIVENEKYPVPFSFLNLVFINPNIHKQDDLPEIFAHEKVHIRENHWVDLMIIELLTVLFWFNPFIWFFERSIKQNHEYLADKGVLSLGHKVGRYQALLVNQLMGVQVIGVTNNLNFALNANRLKMMTKMKTPKIKNLKFSLALPVLALLLFAFAEPDYRQKSSERSISQTRQGEKELIVKGIVTREDNNKPLPGTSIVLRGTTIGTVTDMDGKFTLTVPEPQPDEKTESLSTEVVFSYVGYKTQWIKVKVSKEVPTASITCSLKEEIIGASHKYTQETEARPNPTAGIKKQEVPKPEINGKVMEKKEVFIMVEEMPDYPGGSRGFEQYINEMQAKILKEKEVHGKAYIGFTIDKNGKPSEVKIVKADNEEVGKYSASIIEQMQDWKPGKQHGKPVPVKYNVAIEF